MCAKSNIKHQNELTYQHQLVITAIHVDAIATVTVICDKNKSSKHDSIL